MTAKNETLDAVLDELKKHGITYTISHGTKHIQVQWVNRLGEPRFTTVTRHDGEWRQARNARHQIRQKLRVDGMISDPDNAPIGSSSGVQPISRTEYLLQEVRKLDVRLAKIEQQLKGQTA